MVVKNTLWDILAAQNATKSEAVLIAAGVRGVFDEPGDYYLSSPKVEVVLLKQKLLLEGPKLLRTATLMMPSLSYARGRATRTKIALKISSVILWNNHMVDASLVRRVMDLPQQQHSLRTDRCTHSVS